MYIGRRQCDYGGIIYAGMKVNVAEAKQNSYNWKITMSETRALYYVRDPMCSWCWAFAPAGNYSVSYPATLRLSNCGGLAPDSDEAKALEKAKIKAIQEGYY